MKTSWCIMDPKWEGGRIWSTHAPHQSTACSLWLSSSTHTLWTRSAITSSTVHPLSGQVHFNQKPTCLSMDAKKNPTSAQSGRSFHLTPLAPKRGSPCMADPAHPWGRAEGKRRRKLTQFRTSRTGKQLKKKSWPHLRKFSFKRTRVKTLQIYKTGHLQDVSSQVFCLFKFL